MAYGVIYKITNKINGKIYIGQTTRTVEQRFKEHMESPYPLGNALRFHGIENFTVEIIAECDNQEQLNEREIHFIAEYDCMVPKGYNCNEGGHNGSASEETKSRISEGTVRRFSDPEERAKQAERTRKSFEDPERVAKHSESQKKRFEDPAERQKVADGVSAHFSKPGEREAQSERITAYFNKPGAREKNSAAQKKRFEDPAEHQKVSGRVKKYFAEHPEVVKKISEKNKGRKESDETRARKSIAQKARQAKLRLERLPKMITKQNLLAAKWNVLPTALLSKVKQFTLNFC